MANRIIEVVSTGTHLSKERGFAVLDNKALGVRNKIDIESCGLFLIGAGVTITSNLLSELSRQNIAVVIVGQNYYPSAYLAPEVSHTNAYKNMTLQIAASGPLKKRIWQAVVQLKISNQAVALEKLGKNAATIAKFSGRVTSGDKDNVEAQAAKAYWPLLFDADFRRNQVTDDDDMLNIGLNYGYAVLRAAMARTIFSSGLHSTLGIHHKNQSNSLVLVDDLMEPFRPAVDFIIASLAEKGRLSEFSPDAKKAIAESLISQQVPNKNIQLGTPSGLITKMYSFTRSFVRSLEEKKILLINPQVFDDDFGV